MPRFQSLRILQTLYGLAFLALVVVAGVVGTTGLVLNDRLTSEAARIDRLQRVAEEARGDLYRQTKEVFDYHFLGDPQAGEQYRSYASRIDEKLTEMRTLATSPDEADAVVQLIAAYDTAREQADAIMARDIGAVADSEKLVIFDTEYEEAGLTSVELSLDRADQVFLAGKRKLASRVSTVTWLAFAALLVSIGLAALILLFARSFLQRAFVRPLSEILQAMARFGADDLDHRVDESGATEMVDLQRAINRMADEVAHSRAALVKSEKQAALGALVPVVAHNIRNPLASIRATAQLLPPGEDPAAVDKAAKQILGAVDRLSNWLTALLSYLDPERAHRADASLADCADHALDLLSPRLTERDIRIERDGWRDGGRIALDTHLMEQALYGLLANAAEASPSGGALTLSVGGDQEQCWLSIHDQGPGVPFEPNPDGSFPGPTTKTYGSGLGIPFAFKICDLHDGNLEYEQPSTGGTRVTITIPMGTTHG
jgi:signal transduction histidine kinase